MIPFLPRKMQELRWGFMELLDERTARCPILAKIGQLRILDLRGSQWVFFCTPCSPRQEGRDDFELEVVLITVAVGAPLEDTDLVVESLHQAKAHLVLRVTVRRDAVPVAVDHRRERLVGREPLPLEALCPPREEGAGSALGRVVPELAKGLFEQVRGVEPRVGLE
jgi:hypothetical protein